MLKKYIKNSIKLLLRPAKRFIYRANIYNMMPQFEKKRIKINFCDFWPNFDKKNNCFTNIFNKYYIVEISDSPDFLVYSCFGNQFKNFRDSIKIFYAYENIRPDFNECDYSITLDNINFGERHLRRASSVTRDEIKISKSELTSRKFCNFIYSNASMGKGAILRQEFCEKLSQYKRVDCAGRVLHNMSNTLGPTAEEKISFLKNYKFTIAFENSSAPGYLTEKIYQPLKANSVPIYWGDPDVARIINPKAFINCHNFPNFDAVLEYIKYLDNNDEAYLQMLFEPPILDSYDPYVYDLDKFLVHIVEHGKHHANSSFAHYVHIHEQELERSLIALKNSLMPISFISKIDLDAIFNALPYEKDKKSTLASISNTCLALVEANITNAERDQYNQFTSNINASQRLNVLKNCYEYVAKNNKNSFSFINDQSKVDIFRDLFALLSPHDMEGSQKIRIGGKNDGGYVMCDPGRKGIAYSIDASNYLPWDEDMIARDFHVFQFDGTIKTSPQKHSNLHFYAKNLSGKEKHDQNGLNIAEIFGMLGHGCEKNIILRINIEGGEWEFFENIALKELAKFKQIIVEFHDMTNFSQLPFRKKIFEKICEQHIPVHFHYNNNGQIIAFEDFIVSSLWEITFVRKGDAVFSPSLLSYPTSIDSPNITQFPDIYIGKFSSLTQKIK